MFGERQQEQVEDDQRGADQQVLHRVQAQVAQQLPEQEHREGEQDEQQAVLHRPFGLLVVVDGLDEVTPNVDWIALVQHRRAVDRGLEPGVGKSRARYDTCHRASKPCAVGAAARSAGTRR